MSELLTEQAKRVADNDSESENSDIDSDGYDKNDPYAAMAKRIDKRNKIMEEYNERPVAKLSQAIIDNRENMTYFEKHMLKYVFLVGLLVYLIYTNCMNPTVITTSAKGAIVTGSSWTMGGMLGDATRELTMLTIAVGGYLIMANINNYLDKVEEVEEEEAALQREKDEAPQNENDQHDGETKKEK